MVPLALFKLGGLWQHLFPRFPLLPPVTIRCRPPPAIGLPPGTFLQLRATTPAWRREETTLSKIELYLFHRDLYFFPAPWGGVEGRVFLDRNRNGQFDPGEPGIPGVAVVLDGEEKTVTDNRGYFRLFRLKKGEYLLAFSPREGTGYLTPAAKQVSLKENRILAVEVPVLPPLDLQGLALPIKNRNGLPTG